MKNRRFLVHAMGMVSFLSLAACQEPQTVVTNVPYQSSLTGVIDGNLRVRQGSEAQFNAMGQEWSDYALQVGLSPTVSGDYNDAEARTIGGIPVMTGPGHMQEVTTKWGLQVYTRAWVRQNAVTGLHSILLEMDVRKGQSVSRIRETIPLNTNDQKKGGAILFQRTVQLQDGLHALVVRVLPGPGLISRSEYEQGTGSADQGPSNTSWGTALPFEKSGGSLSDVTNGQVGDGGLHDPTFHDPIRPNRGGFGHLVD